MPHSILFSKMADNLSWQITVAVLSAVALAWVYTRRRRRWRPVGKLANIYIYPLKSGKYKAISSAQCTPMGLRCPTTNGTIDLRDRVFVIYSEEKMELYTGRKNSTLIFIEFEPKTKNSVVFSHPDKPSIEVTIPEGNFFGKMICMWRNEKVNILDCGDEVAKWLSELTLGTDKGLRMGYWPENEDQQRDIVSHRPQEIPVFKNLSNKYTGAYTDLASYLLINKSSVDDLNSKIDGEEKTEVLNCRPNLVIEGPEPYAEDKWDRIKIGDVEFQYFRPCTRCVFTTIDHKTGKRLKKDQPLKTLRTYRTMRQLGEDRVEATLTVMGIFLGITKAGEIKQGDTVYVS